MGIDILVLPCNIIRNQYSCFNLEYFSCRYVKYLNDSSPQIFKYHRGIVQGELLNRLKGIDSKFINYLCVTQYSSIVISNINIVIYFLNSFFCYFSLKFKWCKLDGIWKYSFLNIKNISRLFSLIILWRLTDAFYMCSSVLRTYSISQTIDSLFVPLTMKPWTSNKSVKWLSEVMLRIIAIRLMLCVFGKYQFKPMQLVFLN